MTTKIEEFFVVKYPAGYLYWPGDLNDEDEFMIVKTIASATPFNTVNGAKAAVVGFGETGGPDPDNEDGSENTHTILKIKATYEIE